MLAPGLEPQYHDTAANILRIVSLSALAAGLSAIHAALLYTDRRFAPSAFNQAVLNVFTIAGALSLWRVLGVYGFAIGYTAGAWVQFAIVYFCARSELEVSNLPPPELGWRDHTRQTVDDRGLRPSAGHEYYVHPRLCDARRTRDGGGARLLPARHHGTDGVPGGSCLKCAAARDRAFRSQFRLREAWRLIDKTIALAAVAAVAGCAIALAFRRPVIELMFQRGSFTAESTVLVSAVFLGLGPSLIGWSLLEVTARSLFALDRPRLPMMAAAIPVVVNVIVTLTTRSPEPHLIGAGASLGLLAGFLFVLVMARVRRRSWLGSA